MSEIIVNYDTNHYILAMFETLDQRSRQIFRLIVDAYMETGAPIGSRTLSEAMAKKLHVELSPATIRNVMCELEETGLLESPHTSAGRLPTHLGLRFFVDGLMEIGALTKDEKESIDAQCLSRSASPEDILQQAVSMLSGLSSHAGLVVAPKKELTITQIQFVNLGPGRILCILVSENGHVENRIIESEVDMPASSLIRATNFLNEKLKGRTLSEAEEEIIADIKEKKTQLDALSSDLVSQGLAIKPDSDDMHLIVRGASNLLGNVKALEELESMQRLFRGLEEQETILKLLHETSDAAGVKIFIGSENKVFQHAGISVITAPLKNTQEKVVGAVGVIGPTSLNYGRIVPIVDYTASIMTRLIR